MKRRLFFTTAALAIVSAAGVVPARADEGSRKPLALVIAAPANRSPDLHKQLRRDLGRLYTDLRPGDRLVFMNASTGQVVTDMTVPDSLGDSDQERDEALLDGFSPIQRFLGHNDPDAPVDNVHIPNVLREIGHNVLGRFPGRKAQVILAGSMLWDEPREANWSFRDHLPSDYWLREHGGFFGLAGEETLLSGALVSVLFSDRPEAFSSDGFKQMTTDFLRKSIKGRGGRLGEISPYASGSYSRLFAETEDTTPAVIDNNAQRVLFEPGMTRVKVQRLGELPITKGSANDGSAAPDSAKMGNRSRQRRLPAQGAAGSADSHRQPPGGPVDDTSQQGS